MHGHGILPADLSAEVMQSMTQAEVYLFHLDTQAGLPAEVYPYLPVTQAGVRSPSRVILCSSLYALRSLLPSFDSPKISP
jgi:hypothetical protein